MLHNCKQAQQIGVEFEHKPVGFKRWLQLKVHIFYCSYCRRFLKQSALINTLLKRMSIKDEQLGEGTKAKMQHEIEVLMKQGED